MKFLLFLPLISNALLKFQIINIYKKSSLYSIPMNEILNNNNHDNPDKYKYKILEITKEMVEEEKEEMIEVLICGSYGGWGISSKARKKYRDRTEGINKEIPEDSAYYKYGIERHDPILVQIYKELGEEFNHRHSRAEIEEIPKKYENYYTISEYDGLESVNIDYYRYDKEMYKMNIETILKSEMNNDEKIEELKKVVFKDKEKEKE